MHYIGNCAIIPYDGQRILQLTYRAGYTILSLFMPIIVLVDAVIGGGDPDIWQLLVGGTFAGAAI